MTVRIRQTAAAAMRSLRDAIAAHPVEMAMALHAYAAIIVRAHLERPAALPALLAPYVAAPVFIVAAYILGATLRKGPARWIYRLWWAPYMAMCLVPSLDLWTGTASYMVTVFVLLPLSLLLFRMPRDDRRFVAVALGTAQSAIVAIAFSSIALLLFHLTYMSVTYIFELPEIPLIGTYDAGFAYAVLAPMIFFAMQDSARESETGFSRIEETLLNAVITPALLIYTSVLYLYAAKILLTWSLPKGGVANMVFAFTIAAVAVKALQHLISRRRYDWFFDRFGLLSLPPLLLFWAGTARRISEYGLTESRFYLVLCGAVMTLCLLLFLVHRMRGRYFTVALAAFALFAATAYIPAISAERAAVDSQVRRARATAARLGILDEAGRLRLGQSSPADTALMAQHRALYQSLQYVGNNDCARLEEEFGIADCDRYLQTLSAVTARYASAYREPDGDEARRAAAEYYIYADDRSGTQIDITEYTRLDAALVPEIIRDGDNGDVIRAGGTDIPADALLDAQLAKLGRTRENPPSQEQIDARSAEFLTYRTDSMLVIFRYINFSIDPDGTATINDAHIEAMLTK